MLIIALWFVGFLQGPSLITSAANVRLREAPVASARIVDELPLGTRLEAMTPSGKAGATDRVVSDGWTRVRTLDGADGWVAADLIRAIDPARPLPVIEAIVRARLPSSAQRAADARGGGESFASRIQIARLIDEASVEAGDRETAARFALYQLRALSYALGAVPFRRGRQPPYGAWLGARAASIVYNEPGGMWMVSSDHVRRVHDQHRGTAAADDIAWFRATNGLAGECEGDLPCAVSWRNTLEGEYLRLQPRGAHVEAAHARIASGLSGYLTNVESFPKVLAEFTPATRCGELRASLDPLRAAVTAAESARKAEALAAIARYARLCDGAGT